MPLAELVINSARPPQETQVTKKEIVKTISESCGLTQLQTKEIVQKTFEAIIDTLVEDPRHRIELRNFGVFEVKKRAARKARNPRTGDRVDVPSKWVVTFKPGKEMEEKVLQQEAADRESEAQAAQTPPPAPPMAVPSPPEATSGGEAPPAVPGGDFPA